MNQEAWQGEVLYGDALEVLRTLDAGSVQTCITSPPYYMLRDYGIEGQLGLEGSVDEYVAALVGIFGEVRRVLRDDGTLWLNIGDSYNTSPAGNRTFAGTKQDKNVGSKRGPQARKVNPGIWRKEAPKRPADVKAGCGVKRKELLMVPARLQLALSAAGWYFRSDVIWAKRNVMPESIRDRPTRAHEHILFFSKRPKYAYYKEQCLEPTAESSRARLKYPLNQNQYRGYVNGGKQNINEFWNSDKARANIEEGRNMRNVWELPTSPYRGAHFATFPEDLPRRCILLSTREGDVVLDPFFGSGTTGAVAIKTGRRYVGIELNLKYRELIEGRLDEASAERAAAVRAADLAARQLSLG